MGRTDYDDRGLVAQKKRTRLSSLLIFIAMPLTIALSYIFFGNAKYMITSLLIVIYTMLPFFMIFENRKPKAREIVLVAMMTAITVLAHMFFHVTVPIQIGTAMVVIAGVSLGSEAGFLVGALSRFVCNFFTGQGPWTPWQMFAWGLLGFLAGLCFNKAVIKNQFDELTQKNKKVLDIERANSHSFKILMAPIISIMVFIVIAYVTYIFVPTDEGTFWGWRVYAFGAVGLICGAFLQKKKLPTDSITLTIFTFFTTLLLYGGIMNLSVLFTSSGVPGMEMSFNTLRMLYVSGLPYDLAHSAIASVCMFVIASPMIQKLERIKVKYGIYR